MAEAQPRTNAAPAADPVLAKIVGRLTDLYHPERIYLFGLACVRIDAALEPVVRGVVPLTEYAWRKTLVSRQGLEPWTP